MGSRDCLDGVAGVLDECFVGERCFVGGTGVLDDCLVSERRRFDGVVGVLDDACRGVASGIGDAGGLRCSSTRSMYSRICVGRSAMTLESSWEEEGT